MSRIFFILGICVLISCGGKEKIPDGVLKKKQMTDVLSDVLIADAVVNNAKNHDTTINIQSLSPAYYQQVFTLHKITKEEFFRSYEYYLSHPDLLKEVLDSANSMISGKIMPGTSKPDKNNLYEKARIGGQ